MRLFLVILAFSQFQGYEQKSDGANFSTQFRVHPEFYGMRQMSNDQVDSIKSDRINYFQDDQIPMKTQEASTPGRPAQNVYQQKFENAQPRVMSPDTAQDYTEFQRGQDYPSQGRYQPLQTAGNYNVANQNYGPSPAQAPKNYQPQQISQDLLPSYQNSEPGPVSLSVPGGRPEYMPAQPDYRVYNEIPQPGAQYSSGYQPQMMPQNYQVFNQGAQQSQPNYAVSQDGRQDYTQSTWAGPQQNPQNYQLVNKNADSSGVITISLPDNEDTSQGGYNTQQRQQQPQFVNGYQVINEGPVDYMVSGMAPGSTISTQNQNPPLLPTNYNSAANVNPQDGYNMPIPNAYSYPPDAAGGQYYRQSQNEVYTPYMGSYKPVDQQREVQYDMWKPQQPQMPITMQMPMPYLDGSKESQDKLMEMINSQLARQTLARTARMAPLF